MNQQAQTTPEPSEDEKKRLLEIQGHLLTVGIEDYGFWWAEMLKQKSQPSEPEKPFRRGRIWC